ncbi:MAG: exosortase A [Terriglobales bacterium]
MVLWNRESGKKVPHRPDEGRVIFSITFGSGHRIAHALELSYSPSIVDYVAKAAPLPERALPVRARRWWQGAALVLLTGGLYFNVLWRLVEQWSKDPNFSHGFFVPLFSLFLLWQDRERLSNLPAAPSFWGLPILLFGVVVLLLGVLGAELFLSRASLLLVIAGLVIFFQGWACFRAVLFPWAFLLLMIPLPAIVFNQITFPLQLLASKVAAAVLPLAGVPVLREGNIINLPAMPLEVAEACSGIRSLLSLTTLSIIYGYMMEKRIWLRVVLALASIPIAVAANSFRIVGTGLLVQYWDPEKAQGFFHEFSGWLVFVASLLMLYMVHQGLRLWLRNSEGGT